MASSASIGQSLEEIRPIDRRRTAVTVNCILLRMIDNLNHFAHRSEDIILKAENYLKNADIKLRILEQKLSSVIIDDEAPRQENEEVREVSDLEAKISPSVSKEPELPKPIDQPSSSGSSKQENISEEVNEGEKTVLIKDDPRYSKYFKMLKMGVLEAAVRQKMQSEGVDPSIISRGNEKSTNATQSPMANGSDSESISSFSDSD